MMSGESPKLFVLLLLGILCCRFVITVKLKLTSEHDCDRHSLEALCYEKYLPETERAFADVTEFVNNAADRMSDSLIALMADLPGRDSSNSEERKVYTAFDEIKKRFVRNVNKLKTNITSAWESLLEAHYSLMLDDGKFTLSDVLNRTNYVADSYVSSRSELDAKLGFVISALKDIIRRSLQGISAVAETEIKNEETEKSKKSNTSDANGEDQDGSNDAVHENKERSEENQTLSKDELLKNKKKEMVKSLAPDFLGKLSLILIDKDIDLGSNVTTKSEDRDSVLDDMSFALVMIRSRVNTYIHEDSLKSKETRDLARRSLYIYFADKAAEMYEDRIKKKSNKTFTDGDEKTHSWRNEDDLVL